MRDKICYIVGAGENCGLDFAPKQGDYVIAADGGYKYLQQKGIKADLLIGDFDTLHYKPAHNNVITLNKIKDDTDTLAAVREGIKKGYSNFHIYCGTGGRIEHTLANLQLLASLSQQNLKCFLFGKDCIITALTKGEIRFNCDATGYISVFAFSDKATGVCIKGLKYQLDNATLINSFPIGVSNEFVGKISSVSVANGTLLIVFSKEAMGKISGGEIFYC